MPHFLRRAFPVLAVGLLAAALAWAVSFGTLPPADFSFDNGTDVETIDPAMSTGQPENRVINGMFEGLLRNMPEPGWEKKYAPNDNVPMTAMPAMAESYTVSDDGRVYTFTMRPTARWSNEDPVTAEHFRWSWRRTLHPETGSKYAYQLHYIVGAKEYNQAIVKEGDSVEVELADRRDEFQPFPSGTIVCGRLVSLHKPPEPVIPQGTDDDRKSRIMSDWKRKWVYVAEIGGARRCFAKNPTGARQAARTMSPAPPPLYKLEACMQVLMDFDETVGVKAEGNKLIVTLSSRTPFFTDLVAFYPLYPVHPPTIEAFGSPNWTRAENIVSNGPFKLQFRRIRDRIRMVKNEHYWDAENVKLYVIDALAVKGATTSLNMFLDGQVDWSTQMPVSTIPTLKQDYAQQFRFGPELTTYFYRINITRSELSDKRVRRALAMAINKKSICENVSRAGESPATSLCPPGMAGYVGPPGAGYDVAQAQRLLAEAGYPGGRGLPTIEILYNTDDAHRTIAETIQQMWKENLGVDAELRGLEWGVYLDSQHTLDYDTCRAGWVADYSDPNTFLDMFVTGGDNNQTGWSNARYDELIRQAASESDAARRMSLFHEAETILLDEQPIIPIYFRVSKHLVQQHVKGFFNSVMDEHPLKLIEIVK
ncbi:MAG: peptide ABC transporter substrate-binding protein [Planctomycetaceae bacterium]|nr:peptide ABC transporter substrate-binding protein [Planctomycetaceae bacterium]